MPLTLYKTQTFFACFWGVLLMTYGVLAIASEKLVTPYMPTIGPGFTEQERLQLEHAFNDALTLASTAVKASAHFKDPIYKNYFADTDRARRIVDSVFDCIAGGEMDHPQGNPLLASITIMVDYTDTKYTEFACEKGVMAATRYQRTDHPQIIVCAGAGFGHGGINHGYSNVDAITSDYVTLNNNRVSWRMETLGSILLHEFTHCEKLMNSARGTWGRGQRATLDNEYGPVGTREELAKTDTTRNADSFSWYANEVFWTKVCGAFQPPILLDQEDPHCDFANCIAPKPGYWRSAGIADNSTEMMDGVGSSK